MKALILALLLTPGCLAQTEDPPPPVECGWVLRPGTNPETDTETCPATHAYNSQRRHELTDGGGSCWVYETSCVPYGTPVESAPQECRRSFAECQP
jgi:hypothetical protein